MSQDQFTPRQIENWQRYEKVRAGGRFNMLDPRARSMTTMGVDEWVFCMEHYDALRAAAEHAAIAKATGSAA